MLHEGKQIKSWIWKLADVMGMTARLERRDRQRLRADFRAVLTGECGLMEVRGMDASRHGMGVVASAALHPGTLVFVRLKDFGLGGFAHVRRCAPAAEGGFLLGLEFRGELSREQGDAGPWNVKRATQTCGVWDHASEFANG